MSVFSEDWRNCLREQYKEVIQGDDALTRQSLIEVLHEVGFGESELAQLQVEATIRTDSVQEDFVPDLEILQKVSNQEADVQQDFQPHPLECQCPACIEMNVVPHDEDGQPLPLEDMEALQEENKRQRDDPNAPQQLTMF